MISDCAAACNSTQTCSGFVAQRQGTSEHFCCWLKTREWVPKTITNAVKVIHYTSYIKDSINVSYTGPRLLGYTSVIKSDGEPVDARWNDIRHYCHTTVPNCAMSCDKDSTCAGFSFRFDDYEDKGGKNCCFLKSKIADDVSTLPTFSSLGGPIGFTYRKQWQVVNSYRVIPGWDLAGTDLPSGAPLRNTNEAGCRQACDDQGSKCVGFIFGLASWGGCPDCCYLKESFTGAYIESIGQTAYVKMP